MDDAMSHASMGDGGPLGKDVLMLGMGDFDGVSIAQAAAGGRVPAPKKNPKKDKDWLVYTSDAADDEERGARR